MAPKSKLQIVSDPVEDSATESAAEDSFRFPESYRNGVNQSTQVLIPDDNVSSHCILGLVFSSALPDGFPEVYPVGEHDPLLLQLPSLEWSGWDKNTCLRSWPYTVEMGWVDWVRRMMKFLFEDWKTMGIRETIELSQFPLDMNPELLAAAACFWSKSSNALVLHCGLLSPTVLDISHLTGLPSLGREVSALLSPDPYDPPFIVPSAGVSYSKWLKIHFKAKASGPCFHEKVAFYLFWICRFLMAVPGLSVTKEYFNLAICMAQVKRLALAPFVLGSLYKGLFTFVDKKIADSCGGPFRIFQAWLYAYFPQLKPKLNNPLRSDEALQTCRSYAEYFLGFLTQTEESSFQRYFTFFYEDNKKNWPVFYPFDKFEYASERLRPCFEGIPPASPQLAEKMTQSKRLFWASILLPRLIPVGFALNNTPFGNCGFENYSPCQCAKQFGLAQGIPMPFVHPNIAEMASSGPTIKAKDSQMISLMVSNFQHRVKAFQFIDFKTNNATLPAFDEWLDPEYKYLQDKAEITARLPDEPSKAIVPHAGAVPISSVPSGNTRKRKAESIKDSETRPRTRTLKITSGVSQKVSKSPSTGRPKRQVGEVSTPTKQSTRKPTKKQSSSDKELPPRKGKGTKIVDAFEEMEEEENSSKSSQVQKSSFSAGETIDTELAIDQYESFDTAVSDPLGQADWLPELQEQLLHQENPLLQDDSPFM
ncbi:uncharacterized protein LOC131317364 [Rhododendron vialii]|uniref:uncharacterized protein LOC131317364 n=1 Tax=Rhododendron vialii TaxID=182163 RepID=UPI00265E7ED6|nr:uncharacterized protein LOC131317364 [Rhododendron vialii]